MNTQVSRILAGISQSWTMKAFYFIKSDSCSAILLSNLKEMIRAPFRGELGERGLCTADTIEGKNIYHNVL